MMAHLSAINTGYSRGTDPTATDPDWLAQRQNTIGSSEAAACVLGGSPWQSPSQLYESKVANSHQWVNNNMLAGSLLQPVVETEAINQLRGKYPDIARVDGSEQMWRANRRTQLTCTPDLLLHSESADMTFIIECKVTFSWWAQWQRAVETADGVSKHDAVPTYIAMQVQHQLAVLGGIYGYSPLPHHEIPPETEGKLCAYIAVMPVGQIPGSMSNIQQRVKLIGPLQPQLHLITQLEEAALDMLDCIRIGRPPWEAAQDETSDSYYAGKPLADVGVPDVAATAAVPDRSVVATKELQSMLLMIPALTSTISQPQKMISEGKRLAKEALLIAGAEILLADDGRVLATYKPSPVLDWAAYAAACGISETADVVTTMCLYPDLLEAHMTPSDKTRRLLLK